MRLKNVKILITLIRHFNVKSTWHKRQLIKLKKLYDYCNFIRKIELTFLT